jgi:hypothetical protein
MTFEEVAIFGPGRGGESAMSKAPASMVLVLREPRPQRGSGLACPSVRYGGIGGATAPHGPP